MSNAKSAYSVISGYYCEQVVPSSQKDKNRYDRSKRREQKYNEEWKKEKVNVNEIVDKYAPDAESYRDGVKFYFEGKENTVMCDMVGGYLRVKNCAIGGEITWKYDTTGKQWRMESTDCCRKVTSGC